MRVHVYVHVCAHVYTYVYTYMYRVQAYSNAAPVSNAGNSIKRHPGRNGCQRISPFCIIPFDSVGLHSGHGWLVRLLLLAAAAAAGGPPHPSPLPCRALQGGVTLAAGRLPPAGGVSPLTLKFSAPPPPVVILARGIMPGVVSRLVVLLLLLLLIMPGVFSRQLPAKATRAGAANRPASPRRASPAGGGPASPPPAAWSKGR